MKKALGLLSAVAAAIAVTAGLLLWMNSLSNPNLDDSGVGDRQPAIQLATRKTPSSVDVHEVNNCKKLTVLAKSWIMKHRSCTEDRECVIFRSGHAECRAVNFQYANESDSWAESLAAACGRRATHCALYSEYGIEVRCIDQGCVVHDISREDLVDDLMNESRKALDNDA